MNDHEKVDRDLQEIKFKTGKNMTYISFQYTSLEERLASLHINNFKNVEVRFEIIKDANMYEKASYKSKVESVRDLLLDIEINEVPLFVGAE